MKFLRLQNVKKDSNGTIWADAVYQKGFFVKREVVVECYRSYDALFFRNVDTGTYMKGFQVDNAYDAYRAKQGA